MNPNTDHLERCIRTLASSLEMLQRSDPGSIEYEIYRNATVKGFELALETAGKLLRKALKPYFASSRAVDRLSFKDLFRHAAKHDLMSVEAVERWFIYRDNRNTTAHDYGEGFAEETLGLLPQFIFDARQLRESMDRAET
uniref:Nucleotidyltransferase substrate binding protein like n=1 Tax=Candidatus Kentrum sp. FM TaxID=2126340 RepID=A0A450WCN4_9GAMM|nr:MAG: Nucleotidyltransferase substrate binding protein like [Candidatus Kentron sp. FM]VFJ59573.1 MAG: Nucleotidyltransferase substrate binding protein like [Candidatus Kentron sp. FM]VFK14829.1 MAG: Nucleotidyltransferase substrate binding protein like [Candidatus Kentron sp. FM]